MAKNLKLRCLQIMVSIQTEGYDSFYGAIDLTLHGTEKDILVAAVAMLPLLHAEATAKYRLACEQEAPPAEGERVDG